MNTYVLLLRGINVGGKNKVPMAELKKHLEELGFSQVVTYIASGNVILQSDLPPNQIQAQIEASLPVRFKLDSELVKVLVLTRPQFQAVIDHKPAGFGEQPDTYHSDVLFLMDLDPTQTLAIFSPREGVDQVWPGPGVIYSQRLSAQLTKSRLNKVIAAPAYRSMTIRNWNTTTRLLEMLAKMDANPGG
jgi:uncharacterized protein (DUF1697 family)